MVKKYSCDAGVLGSIPGLGRSPGEGNGYPSSILALKFCRQRTLEGYSPWSCKKSDTTGQLTKRYTDGK